MSEIIITVLGVIFAFTIAEIVAGHVMSSEYMTRGIPRVAPNSNTDSRYGVFPAAPLGPSGFKAQPFDPSQVRMMEYQPSDAAGTTELIPYHHPLRSARMIRKTLDGEIIFDVSYKLDEFNRRVVPLSPSTAGDFVLMSGCSFVFGTGVSDDETLPNQVQRHLLTDSPATRVYNLGIPGSSAGDTLWWLKGMDPEQITEPGGILTYTYTDWLLPRMSSSWSFLAWGANHPIYELNEAGELTRTQSYNVVMPVQSAAARFFFRFDLWKLIAFRLPNRKISESWELLIRSFIEMRELGKKKFNIQEFVVIIYPGTSSSPELIRRLEEHKIRYIDYSSWDLPSLTQGKDRFPFDGHPSTAANAVLAVSIAAELNSIRRSQIRR